MLRLYSHELKLDVTESQFHNLLLMPRSVQPLSQLNVGVVKSIVRTLSVLRKAEELALKAVKAASNTYAQTAARANSRLRDCQTLLDQNVQVTVSQQ